MENDRVNPATMICVKTNGVIDLIIEDDAACADCGNPSAVDSQKNDM